MDIYSAISVFPQVSETHHRGSLMISLMVSLELFALQIDLKYRGSEQWSKRHRPIKFYDNLGTLAERFDRSQLDLYCWSFNLVGDSLLAPTAVAKQFTYYRIIAYFSSRV